MADIIDSSWNPNDEANTGIAPDGVQGGYAPSTVAPIIRAIRGAVRRSYEQINPIYTSTGSSNAYVLTYPIAPEKYSKGIIYAFWANHTNTGAATLNINGLGAKAITSSDKNPLVASQILTDTVITVVYDGTAFRMIAASTVNPKFTGTTTLENLTVSGTTIAQAINATTVSASGGSVYISAEGNRHLWFRDPDSKVTGLVFSNGSNNSLHLRSYTLGETTYKEAILQSDGQLILPTYPTTGNAAASKTYVDNAINKTVTAGNGLTGGGALTGNVTITLGAPTTVTNTTTNSVTATGHTHALTLVSGDITGALGYTPQTPAQVSSAITASTNGNMDGRAYPRRVGGGALNFNWSGKGGTPTWIWGWRSGDGAEAQDMSVYNPANFSVSYANSAGNANTVGGWAIANFQNDAQARANDRGYWGTRDYLLAETVPIGTILTAGGTTRSGNAGDVRDGAMSYLKIVNNQTQAGNIGYGSWQAIISFSNNNYIPWKRVG